jgi:hypothetical protein
MLQVAAFHASTQIMTPTRSAFCKKKASQASQHVNNNDNNRQ